MEETTVEATCIAETDLALLVRLDDGGEHWVPKSVILDGSQVFGLDDAGELVVATWFAEKEELG